MSKLKEKLKNVIKSQNSYFRECGQEIAVRNLELMCTLCWAGITIYILYYAFTELFYPQWRISLLYGVMVPLLAVFLVYAKRKLRDGRIDPAACMKVTTLAYAAIMAELIALSVFPHPDVPSVYFPLFLILGPVMFILPLRRQLVITTVSFAVFVYLVVTFKSPVCWSHELFETSTSFIFSLIAIMLMMQMRVQSDILKNKYYALSRMDGLTGILNKTAGLATAESYLSSMRQGEQCAVLFIDIDDFKHINDTRGHLEGDHWLKAVGADLLSVCRRDDIVCRFGGDEFLVLLKDISGRDSARQKAAQFLDAIAESGSGADITCSIGICCSGGSLDEFIKRADQALYKAKDGGKNSICVYGE
jgi:diguanylate cyclase (GGDEF)-like protein